VAAVVAETQASSVNSWSYTSADVLLSRVFFLPLPLEAAWDAAAFQSVLATYLRAILTLCGSSGNQGSSGSGDQPERDGEEADPAVFVRALLASRYAPLPPDARARLLATEDTFTCGTPWDEPAVARALAEYRPRPVPAALLVDAGPEAAYLGPDGADDLPFPRGLRRRIRARARIACTLVGAVPDPALRLLTLEDYVQEVTRHFVGIDRMVPYLRACF
jgi:hypothetical protein